VFFRCLKTDDGYAEIVRWDGAVGNWTSLKRFTGPEYGIEATIEGNGLKGFINGIEVISALGRNLLGGSPGNRVQLRCL
jgi:hypothetical protein